MPLKSRTLQARAEIIRHLNSTEKTHVTPGRLQILHAVFKQLGGGGYDSVTIRSVAKAVELKPSSIYSHFPEGRDEIITEALRWSYHEWGIELIDATRNIDEPKQLWDAFVSVYVRRQLTVPYHDTWDMLWSMDQKAAFLPEKCRDEINAWLSMLNNLMASIIIDMGYVYSTKVARIIVSLFDSATAWCEWSGEERELVSHVENAKKISHLMLANSAIFSSR